MCIFIYMHSFPAFLKESPVWILLCRMYASHISVCTGPLWFHSFTRIIVHK